MGKKNKNKSNPQEQDAVTSYTTDLGTMRERDFIEDIKELVLHRNVDHKFLHDTLYAYPLYDCTPIIENATQKPLDEALTKLIQRHQASRKKIIQSMLRAFRLMDYPEIVEAIKSRCPYTFDDYLNLAIRSWEYTSGKEDPYQDYAEILVFLFMPNHRLSSLKREDFFRIVYYVIGYHQLDAKRLVKEVIDFLQMLYLNEEDEPSEFEIRISDYYPFTDKSIKILVNWLIGKNGAKNLKKRDFSGDRENSEIELFIDAVLKAVVPGKYDLETLMAERWIYQSKRQLSSMLSKELAEAILYDIKVGKLNISCLPGYFFFRTDYELNPDYEFEYDDSLGYMISEKAPLPSSLVMELKERYNRNHQSKDHD